MHHFQSQSCAETFSNSECKKQLSNEDGEVSSLSKINELERCVPRTDATTDNLDLCRNVDIGSMNLESQHSGFGEFEKEISQLTERNKHFSSMKNSNEETTSFSSCPIYVPDDKEERLSDYWKRASISGSNSNHNEPNIIKPNISDYMEEVTSTLHEQGASSSSISIITSSKAKYRAANNVSYKDAVFDTDDSLPKSYENEILCHKNIPKASRKIENHGIAGGHRDEDIQILNQGTKNQISSGVASQASKNSSSEFFDNGEFLVPVDRNAKVVPSITDVQMNLHDKRHISTECGKDFRRKHNRVSRYRTHTGEKPFACDMCEKRFRKSSKVNRHRLIHTGEKPFACDECGKRFNRSDHMARHRRTHSG